MSTPRPCDFDKLKGHKSTIEAAVSLNLSQGGSLDWDKDDIDIKLCESLVLLNASNQLDENVKEKFPDFAMFRYDQCISCMDLFYMQLNL
nr:hypothetical protein Iba_chr06eCG8530 [Ipomoea batatas]